jgi:hypothetical protein
MSDASTSLDTPAMKAGQVLEGNVQIKNQGSAHPSWITPI